MDEFEEASPFFDSRTSVGQRFEAHCFIEQFATERFRCIGIFVADVSNDISEVFVSCLKDYYDVHADGLPASTHGRISHHLAGFIKRISPCTMIQSMNTCVEFC